MENAVSIKRNPRGMQVQIIGSALGVLVMGLLASWLLDKVFGWTESGGATIKRLTWIVLIVIWGFTSLKLWYNWSVKRYEIAKDALLVHAKAGRLGTTQTVYRYESIISIRMTQGFLGKRFGYGDVRLAIPKLDGEIVLNDIADPLKQLAHLQERMQDSAKGGITSSLIN